MKLLVLALTVIMTTGCATMFNGTSQNVSVSPMGMLSDKTVCTLENEEGKWNAAPNISVSIHRDGNPMDVQCNNDLQHGQSKVEPSFDGGYIIMDVLLDWGIISGSVDAYNNSFYDYPTQIVVPMMTIK